MPYRTWETPGVESVREAEVTHLAMTYIGIHQVTVSQWVALLPIFKVFAGEKGYKGGVHRRDAWWSQEAAESHLRENFVEAWESSSRRQQGLVAIQW